MHVYKFTGILLQEGWMLPAFVGVDDSGQIRLLSKTPPRMAECAAVEEVPGYVIPGFRNSHSHAFQYAMAGQAERHRAGTQDDFWSWREAMYGCALAMRPDTMEAIAAQLYAEMLRHGYTHVAEFHYLHHDENGKPYAHLAEMGERLIAAAAAVGIKITLIPVWYQRGDFGKPPFPRQKRFICENLDGYSKLLEASRTAVNQYKNARLAYGIHSLRAVDPPEIIRALSAASNLPFHLHLSEQLREVETCLEYLGLRPAAWLLENLPVDKRFHLVHCTHLNDDEVNGLARSGAQVVLCPGTEGNLGDGIFRLGDFARAHGKWSIGTDSQISLNPLEDLRWLDYGQRLLTHRRNTFDDAAKALINTTWDAGNHALGLPPQSDFFAVGQPLDAVVVKDSSPLLSQGLSRNLLSPIVFTMDSSAMLGTLVDARWVVKNGQHQDSASIRRAYDLAIRKLTGQT